MQIDKRRGVSYICIQTCKPNFVGEHQTIIISGETVLKTAGR